MSGFNGGLTLVVPLQDEESTVVALLQSIAAQALTPTELVVVNAGSHDRTVERVASIALPCPTRVVEAGRVYPGDARNCGVRAATTRWIAFTDGGISLDRGWLAALADAAEAGNADVVLGSYEPVCDSFFTECAALAYVSPRRRDGYRGPSVVSLALRRDVFTTVGGFPSYRASEDLAFLERVRLGGFPSVTAPSAVVHWRMAPGPTATYRRFKLYSYHNLLAGRGRFWHRGVARHYVLAVLVCASCLWIGSPIAAASTLPLWLLMRSMRAAWQKRHSFDFVTWNPLRILGAAGILLLIDAATVAGAYRWLSSRRDEVRAALL
jgi:glycosyltransferase involved in cell wall biosynthesis